MSNRLLTDKEIITAMTEAERLSWTHKVHPRFEKEEYLLYAQDAKTAEIVLKEVGEWLSQNIKNSSSYHNAVCNELIFIEALKKGELK